MTVTIDDGGDSGSRTEEALARLFADPREHWDNLEIAVQVGRTYAAIHWTGFDEDQEAVGSGFLIRMDGESPLGASDTPEILELLDGGSEPFEATARHLLTAEEACWLVGRLERGERPTHWPDGRPLVWSVATVDDAPWAAVGSVEPPYWDRQTELLYGSVVDDEGDEEPEWIGQRALLVRGTLTADQAEALPQTAIWPVLRQLHDVDDALWLATIARHPLPWLQSLIVVLDELDGLAEAVRGLPRLVELGVHSLSPTLPAIVSESLEEVLLEGLGEGLLDAFLRESRLPALRVLAIHSAMLAAPVDFSPLGQGVVVHVEYAADDDLGTIGHAASARTLALALEATHTPEALVAALVSRVEGDTWVSTVWDHAEAAVELARLRGVRLQAR
ncbi:hypothetical protein [Nannocystis bainbridge]|uniref:Uncharacterized protein n=1 Tax=Nannocystis bainbridge TaxID=2995303 RepID=A0ABT5DSN7_9BACT|nr:hypothetical protein [Nannocystis bainbridge]MDC0716651.1 hypothetical protein [Nannocystis bainbridge]